MINNGIEGQEKQQDDLSKIVQWYCCQCANPHGDVEQYIIRKNGGGYYIRNDCSRCNHLMCPYCTKGRLSDYLDEKGSESDCHRPNI